MQIVMVIRFVATVTAIAIVAAGVISGSYGPTRSTAGIGSHATMKDVRKVEPSERDHVDGVYDAWAREMPEISTRGGQILARARWITTVVRPKIEGMFKTFDLDAGEFDVLATLRRAGTPYRMRPTEIYRSLMISSGGLTDRLDRLEERGFIRRRQSTEDGRSFVVELTALGRKRIEAAFEADMALEDRLIEGLTRDEHAHLVVLLRKVMALVEPER